MTTQKMLAHLPLLLAKEPKSVAIIGFGSGVTAGSALQYPIEKLDVVEIAREVIEASRFFEHVNRNPLRDPRTRLIVDDGRNHLRYTDRRYDVIISEPSNPWISGMASLFTKEFFAESAARLADGGVHCQWFHGYNMSPEDLRTVIATFRTAFPHALLWTLTGYDLLLVGSKSPIDVDPHEIEQKFNRVQEDLEGIKIGDTYTITSSFLLRDADLDRFSRGAVLNTDDRPILEFSAPLSIYADTTAENIAALSGAAQSLVVLPATSENHLHKAEALFAAEAFPEAQKEFEAALNEHASEIIRLSAADFYARQGQYPKATSLLEEVVKTDPNNVDALEKLDDALAEISSPRLAEVTERLLKVAPDSAIGLHHLATIRLYTGRFDEAIAAAKKALQRDPKSGRTRSVLAIAYDRTFQPELAEAEFRRAIAESPDDWVSYNNYGIFLLGRNRAADAIQQFQRAVDLNPENTQGLVGMSEALDRAGRTREAQAWRRRAEMLK
jgi:spermidine synthase